MLEATKERIAAAQDALRTKANQLKDHATQRVVHHTRRAVAAAGQHTRGFVDAYTQNHFNGQHPHPIDLVSHMRHNPQAVLDTARDYTHTAIDGSPHHIFGTDFLHRSVDNLHGRATRRLAAQNTQAAPASLAAA